MAKTWLMVILGIIAIGFGAGMFYMWGELRPADQETVKWGVSAITALASFTCLYYLTKGWGSGGE